jgi:phosphatidylglycerophosphate synthase
MAVVVVVRELMVTAIRAEMEKAGRDFSAALAGKLKMVLQCLAVAAVLAGRAWPGLAIGDVGIETAATGLAWGAIIATAWSGIEYLVAARPLVA